MRSMARFWNYDLPLLRRQRAHGDIGREDMREVREDDDMKDLFWKFVHVFALTIIPITLLVILAVIAVLLATGRTMTWTKIFGLTLRIFT